MPKKIELKTAKSKKSPFAMLQEIESEQLRKDCKKLWKIFKECTGLKPKLWGESIVGFGEYTYYRSNGDEGQFMACGFSPRKSGPTLYIMPGYQDYSKELNKLGPHKIGKSCLYLKSMDGIDEKVLKKLIKMGLQDLKKSHKVNY